MASNILVLPFRRTPAVSLSAAIKQYISMKYEQHPDMFTQDLEEIDVLRTNAVNALEPHTSGIKKLQSYAAQVVYIGGKFPIDIGADFTWYPSLGYNTKTAVSQNNLRFELANVLFNLAVMYCQLAVNSNRSTPDGLKVASNYFCLSAGVLSHIKSTVVPDMRSNPPEDMDAVSLECLEQLLLAQAQECFWQKACKDGLKDASIAKLAAKVSDLYAQAADFAVKSDAISSEWIHHMSAKHHHFAGAAQYRAACDCLEKRKYGEEVARLQDSVACVNEALKESRYLNKAVLADLNGLRNKVQDDLKRAEKDNDKIYLMPVPPKSELKTLDRANMVSAKVPTEVSDPLQTLGDNAEFGRPLFSKLVPFAVHAAASIYADRRDRTIGSVIEELELLTDRIHEMLQSNNLPGSLQALEKPLGLPPGLVSRAEEIRQQNGLDRIYRSIDDVSKLKQNDRSIFQEGQHSLQAEAAEDEEARGRFGTDRWARLPSREAANQLYGRISELEGYFKGAESSDSTVRTKLAQCEAMIRILNGTDRDLEDYVPSSRRAVMTPGVEKEVTRLRRSLEQVNKVDARRRRKAESLKIKAQADDVNHDILREAARMEREWPMQKIEAVQFEDFFDQRLKKYETDQKLVQEEEQDQEQLLAEVAQANSAFQSARRGDTSTKEREQALQKLENAYYEYKAVLHSLDVGRTFYNNLASHVSKFRDDCRSFVYQRKSEAAQLESDITMALPMAGMNISQAPRGPPPQPQPYPTSFDQHRRAAAPIAAPVAVKPPPPIIDSHARGPVTGVWNPDVGIKFAGVTTPISGHANGNTVQQQAQAPRNPGVWDPSKGMKFSR